MNHPISSRTEHLFIVRVWWEPDGVTATAQWRGSVQHGPGQTGTTGERRYFASWEAMMNYLTTAHASKPIDASNTSDASRTCACHTPHQTPTG